MEAGYVQSFAHPGGNMTGFMQFEASLNSKWLQLLKDVAPNVTRVAVLRVENPGIRRAVAELLPAMPWVAQAARFLVVCGDSRRIRRVCELRGIPFANDHLNPIEDAVRIATDQLRGRD